jgi:uncharacterized membrane protein
MAGIGFQLRNLAQRDSLSSIVAAAGHAAIIAAGPWLFTILALGFVALITEPIAGLATLSDFRAIIIYSFAVSLVFAAPVTIVATRLVGDALWRKQPERVPSLLVAALAASLVPVALAIMPLLVLLRPPASEAIALVVGCLLVAMIWVALAFCGAVRDYRGVTLSFVFGLIASVATTVALTFGGYSSGIMALGFIAGLALTFLGLLSRVFITFPQPINRPLAHLVEIAQGMIVFAPLAIGALIGNAGVWIDKVVFWLSPVGVPVSSGLLHAPIYDSTMFLASLIIIPSLSAFVITLETGFFDRYQQYYATIASHGTLAQIENARTRIARYSLENLSLILIIQVGLTAIVLLTAPVIIDALGLQFRQSAILRFGALGAIFQFIFIAATSMLLFFDRRKPYLALQTLFFVLNASFAYASIRIGENAFGTGFFAACFLSSLVAYLVMERTFRNLNFLTFIGNNPSIQPARARWKAAARS